MKRCGIVVLVAFGSICAQERSASVADRERVARYLADDSLQVAPLVRRGEPIVTLFAAELAAERRAALDPKKVLRTLAALDAFGAAAASPIVLTRLEPMLAEDLDTAVAFAVLHTLGTLLPWVPRERAGELGQACDRRLRSMYASVEGDDVQRLSDIGQRIAMRRQCPVDAPIEHLRRCIASESNAWAVEVAIEVARTRGVAAAATLDALVRRLEPANPNIRGPGPVIDVREKAAFAVIAVAPEPAAAVPGHAWLAEHGEPQVAVESLAALGALGEKSVGAVTALMRIARDGTRPTLRRDAVVTLGAIGPGARAATSLLTELRDGEDRTLSTVAARALDRIGE